MSYSDTFLEYKFVRFKYDNGTKNLSIKATATGYTIIAESSPLSSPFQICCMFDKDEKCSIMESLLIAVKVAESHFGKLTQPKEGGREIMVLQIYEANTLINGVTINGCIVMQDSENYYITPIGFNTVKTENNDTVYLQGYKVDPKSIKFLYEMVI